MQTNNVKEVSQVDKLREELRNRLVEVAPQIRVDDVTDAVDKFKSMQGGCSRNNILRYLKGEVRNLGLAEQLATYFEYCAKVNMEAKEKKLQALPIN